MKLDPDSAEQPPDLPGRRAALQVHQNDPAMLSNDDYVTKWQAVLGQ